MLTSSYDWTLALRLLRVIIFAGPLAPKLIADTCVVASENVGDGGPDSPKTLLKESERGFVEKLILERNKRQTSDGVIAISIFVTPFHLRLPAVLGQTQLLSKNGRDAHFMTCRQRACSSCLTSRAGSTIWRGAYDPWAVSGAP